MSVMFNRTIDRPSAEKLYEAHQFLTIFVTIVLSDPSPCCGPDCWCLPLSFRSQVRSPNFQLAVSHHNIHMGCTCALGLTWSWKRSFDQSSALSVRPAKAAQAVSPGLRPTKLPARRQAQ
ncbi:hypothetical protein BDV33DRAFT_64944 [Aspergillus novoparasiticus]|uniref:Uncharacterized protein n=1 Tax=Aspergillus novoparasiticus TaxID=986946 RepID=A0A5N6EYR7_9EURO|nr:hypothetical protein BDV33DRAFT_64944 [Aspergillus novoparasiticus]